MQGVRQLSPEDAVASAPGGSVSILRVIFCGQNKDFILKSKSGMLGRLGTLGMSGIHVELHAETLRPHATMAMTRFMIVPPCIAPP